jgi:sulfotransferase family protein
VREQAPTKDGPGIPLWERLGELDEYEQLCRVRLDHVVPVREPVVLVSQVQRSGGTLLSRLFDGHPECHAHPYELHIGRRRRSRWSKLPLDQPDQFFRTLYEAKVAEHLTGGYSKPGLEHDDVDVFPFVFLPRLQKRIFDACIAAKQVESRRDVYNCYFTSYFNAWVDNQNLYTGPKRIVTGFTPRMILHEPSIRRFFEAYPDGTLVSLVRDPRSWYASASRHRPKYEDVGEALTVWRDSVEAALAAAARFGDRVLIVTYEELVQETEATMTRLAERLGISMHSTLLSPTFNGREIRPNSSDRIVSYGVVTDRTDRYRDVLEPNVIERIDELAGGLYQRACESDARL